MIDNTGIQETSNRGIVFLHISKVKIATVSQIAMRTGLSEHEVWQAAEYCMKRIGRITYPFGLYYRILPNGEKQMRVVHRPYGTAATNRKSGEGCSVETLVLKD
jgi:hypothetical protein